MPALDPSHQLAGSMTVDFFDTGDSLYPVVSFKPVGRITANTIDKHLAHIYSRVQIAQVEARNAPPQAVKAKGASQ